jgi:hypothetical protein
MIYIQLVCFVSPRQGSGIEKTQLVGYKFDIKSQTMDDPI